MFNDLTARNLVDNIEIQSQENVILYREEKPSIFAFNYLIQDIDS